MELNDQAYRQAVDRLQPDAEFERRVRQRLKTGGGRRKPAVHPAAVASIAAVVVLAAAIAGEAIWGSGRGGTNSLGEEPAAPNGSVVSPPSPSSPNAVYVPAIELPKRSSASADMIGLIVYQGRIYTQTSTSVPPEAAAAIRGEKLGRTLGNLDEWSRQDEFAVEFASSIGEADVYAVQGYDPRFRIMSYFEQDGEVWAELYECLNGIEIASGADVFGQLKMAGNVRSARWQDGDSYNWSREEYGDLEAGETLDAFVRALNDAVPIERAKLEGKSDQVSAYANRKYVEVELEDRTVVSVVLFKDGYAAYGNLSVLYRVGAAEFDAMWKLME